MQATRIGIAGFVVPFLFVYAPELLLIGSFKVTLWVTFTAALGLVCLAAGFTGYLINPLFAWQRLLLLGTAVLMITPETVTDGTGLSLMALVVITNWRRSGKPEAKEKVEKEGLRFGRMVSMRDTRSSREEPDTAAPIGKRER